MNWDQIEGQWKQLKGEIQSRWGELTDDDLDKAAGNREKLEGLLQQRYGLTKEQAREQLDSWAGSIREKL
ncbi:MAG: CsbD family protein [Paracoccaceae bacterium]